MAHPIPDGQHTITPHLVIKGASEAIEFYKRAFGAEELFRMPVPGPDGQVKLGHASLQIGDSRLMLADEFPAQGAFGPAGRSPVTIHLYVTDADATFDRAVEAGADRADAAGRHVLGRPLRQGGGPIRASLVDCRASGRSYPRPDRGA